jgi:pSer/pThr/pTyr-binding forkhead associated (FHA) protein
VSRVHCQVRPSAAGLHLLDLRSRCGVFVNGEKVSSALLRDGDRLTLGGVRFLFHQGPGCTADATRDRKRAEDEVDFETELSDEKKDAAAEAPVASAG